MQHEQPMADGDAPPVAAAVAAAAVAAPPQQRAEAGLLPGQLVANKWRLVARIGRGAFGDIFVATCVATDDASAPLQGRRFAIKLEKLPQPEAGDGDGQLDEKAQAALAARAVLKLEAVILSKLQKYPFVGRFVEYGRDMDLSVAYLVMSLLGENLLRLRRRRKDGKFTLPTILRFGIQAVRSIQAVHEVGFLHRDIKPSNFVIGSNRNTLHGSQTGATAPSDAGGALELSLMSPSKICIIDFGLARAFRDRATGSVLPSRGHIKGFRGTPRYASVHVHREEDLSRRDDLWSLFYILVEFCTGDLPWGCKRDKDEIGALKEKFMSLRLLKTGAPGDCPSCLVPFMQHLYSLAFDSKPNYAYLVELLQHKLRKMGYGACEGDGAADAQGEDAPFDWEDPSTLSTMDASIDAAAPTAAPALRSPGQPGFDVDALPSPMPVYSDADGGADMQAEASPVVGAQDLQQQRHALDVEYAPRTPTEIELDLQDQHAPQLPFGSGSFSFSVFGGGGGGAGGGLGGALPSDSCSSLSGALVPQSQVAASLPLTAAALHPCPSLSGSSPFAPADALPLASPVTPAPALVASPSRHGHSASVGAAFLPAHSSSSTLAVPASSAFGTLPLAQPIPVPDTVILSPRKAHARSMSHTSAAAAAGSAAGGASPAPAAAASACVAVPAAVPAAAVAPVTLLLRPTPPAGVPPPAYSVRSFGRFHRRLAERSPSKPLPLAQAQQIICDDEGEVHVALRHIDASTAAMSLESAFTAAHEPTPAPAPPPAAPS